MYVFLLDNPLPLLLRYPFLMSYLKLHLSMEVRKKYCQKQNLNLQVLIFFENWISFYINKIFNNNFKSVKKVITRWTDLMSIYNKFSENKFEIFLSS